MNVRAPRPFLTWECVWLSVSFACSYFSVQKKVNANLYFLSYYFNLTYLLTHWFVTQIVLSFTALIVIFSLFRILPSTSWIGCLAHSQKIFTLYSNAESSYVQKYFLLYMCLLSIQLQNHGHFFQFLFWEDFPLDVGKWMKGFASIRTHK